MHRYSLILLFVLSASCVSHAQQDTVRAPHIGWQHNLVSGLTLTQVAFTNWAQGGDNALAWTVTLEGKSVNNQERTNWANNYKFAFGQARLGDQGLRKTDDKIDFESILTYKIDTYVNPYGAVTFKSQFAKGYKYIPAETAVSKFLDPAYLTQSVGFGYQPLPEVKTRLGLALREVVTSDFPVYADDPATTGVEKTKVEGGLESVTNIEWKLQDNLLLASKLELFAPVKTLDEIVLRSDNSLTAIISKYLTVILNVQLINERVVTPRTQVKQTLSIGFTYTVL